MKNSDLQEYIDMLNQRNKEFLIFKRRISSNVEVAKDWREEFSITDEIIANYIAEQFFFIKNEEGRYIGIVKDMQFDLHCYTLKEFRNKGYMSKALKESIFPYKFNKENKSSLKISIDRAFMKKDEYKSSRKMATNLGFKLMKDSKTNFELLKSNFNFDNSKLNEQNSMISIKRLNELREQIFYAHKILSKVSDELLMAYDNDSGLAKISEEIKDYIYIIQDEYLYGNSTDI